jgi:ribosomal protein S18 acetylase RimI-like enzyme
MALSIELVEDPRRLAELTDAWTELARQSGEGALLRGPAWIQPWFQRFGAALEATLHVVVGWDGAHLVGLAPLYTRYARLGPGVRTREVRLLGDAGPRPPALDLLAVAGFEERFAHLLAHHFGAEGARPWDVIDLAPLRDPSRARAHLAEKLDVSGRKVDTQDAGSTLVVTLAGAAVGHDSLPPADPDARVVEATAVEKGLVALRRLSRVEWADRDEPSPFADLESTRFLADVLGALGPRGQARLARLDDAHGEALAAMIIVDDAPRAVCVGLAVDPEARAAGTRLLSAEARAAAERGLRALDVVVGAADLDPPPLPVSHRRSLRLRAFNATAAGTVARTYSSLRRRAEAAREAPGAAAAGARAAWAKIREAAGAVATYERLHLYRGQLWTRGVVPPSGLSVDELDEAAFDALPPAERQAILERLELDEAYCREKWRRGDLVVIARLAGRPAGIAWCARSAVFVAEIGREVRPGPLECYIHDVYVAADARGRNVAPAMLEDLARRLRQRDVYRAWALIEPANVASTRAFEKAAYASVADVIYARMSVVDKLVLRPPDPEARRLLGLS